MAVTLAIRYSVADAQVGMAEVKRARAMWTKAGAKGFRSHQFFTGAFVTEWLFHIDFDDFAHLQKCRDTVQNSDDMKAIAANNAKAGCGFRGKSATDSDLKSATDSDLKPATRSEASRPLIPI